MQLGNQVTYVTPCPLCGGKGALTYFFPTTIFFDASEEESWCFLCWGNGILPTALIDTIKTEFCMEIIKPKKTDGLEEKLKRSLKKQGVEYDQMFYNGRYEYKKSTYIHGWTIIAGDRKRVVSWCEEVGWRWDTQKPPNMDPKVELSRKLRSVAEIMDMAKKLKLAEEQDG